MRILLVNDDGIGSEGIRILSDVLASSGHEVWTCAPAGERSGKSHAVTFGQSLELEKAGEQQYACSGTPADCVVFGLFSGIVPGKVDLVVSGINRGFNIGAYIPSSGTCGAASEAALQGFPSMALSSEVKDGKCDFRKAAAFLSSHLEEFYGFLGKGSWLNVNVPYDWNGEWRRSTLDGRRPHRTIVEARKTEKGFVCDRRDEFVAFAPLPGSDRETVEEGYASVSLIPALGAV